MDKDRFNLLSTKWLSIPAILKTQQARSISLITHTFKIIYRKCQF